MKGAILHKFQPWSSACLGFPGSGPDMLSSVTVHPIMVQPSPSDAYCQSDFLKPPERLTECNFINLPFLQSSPLFQHQTPEKGNGIHFYLEFKDVKNWRKRLCVCNGRVVGQTCHNCRFHVIARAIHGLQQRNQERMKAFCFPVLWVRGHHLPLYLEEENNKHHFYR